MNRFVSVCVCVCVCVCVHSHGRISWSIFTKIGTDVKITKIKNEFVGVNSAPPLPHFVPKTPILGQEVLKTHANINHPISALNVRESPKFSRLVGNWGRETRWWHQILDRKWKYGRFAHAQLNICNTTIIIGTVRSLWTWLWSRYHVPQNVFLVRHVKLKKTRGCGLRRQMFVKHYTSLHNIQCVS